MSKEEKMKNVALCQGLEAIDQICYLLRSYAEKVNDEHLKTVAIELQNKVSNEKSDAKCSIVW